MASSREREDLCSLLLMLTGWVTTLVGGQQSGASSQELEDLCSLLSMLTGWVTTLVGGQ